MLRCLIQVENVSKHPSLQRFKEDINLQRFCCSRYSKPFQVRLNEKVGDAHLKWFVLVRLSSIPAVTPLFRDPLWGGLSLVPLITVIYFLC